jgi:redox-sensitive bicupin YhaK (pirin superfamily)
MTKGDSVELPTDDPARLVVIEGKPHGEEIGLLGSFVY